MSVPSSQATPTATPDPASGRPSWNWVPVRSLGPRHRERIMAHLLALQAGDRRLRFGYAASDAQISKYVDMLDFEQDEVFGIFSRRLELVALAHLAHSVVAPRRDAPAVSEFGVSVLPQARRRGFGRRLFEHAMLHARNRGVDTLLIHALTENVAMLRIARDAGASILRIGLASDARVALPPDTLGSHVDELVTGRAAELDYQVRRGAQRVGGLLAALTDGRPAAGGTRRKDGG